MTGEKMPIPERNPTLGSLHLACSNPIPCGGKRTDLSSCTVWWQTNLCEADQTNSQWSKIPLGVEPTCCG